MNLQSLGMYCLRILSIVVSLLLLKLIVTDLSIMTNLKRLHADLHSNFVNYINTYYSVNLQNLLTSILIGTSGARLEKNIYILFKDFNMLHVVSISGANFSLVEEIILKASKYINKRILQIITLVIETYYIVLIGFDNLPALRAYIFSSITIFSSISGRPINYWYKTLLVILAIFIFIPESPTNLSLQLSLVFSIFYRFLYKKPLNKIFNSELKRLSLIFIITSLIFASKNPDFLANTTFSLLYPFIFIITFLDYLLYIFNLNLSLSTFVTFFLNNSLLLFNELNTSINQNIQSILFVFILVITLLSIFKRQIHEYKKFK